MMITVDEHNYVLKFKLKCGAHSSIFFVLTNDQIDVVICHFWLRKTIAIFIFLSFSARRLILILVFLLKTLFSCQTLCFLFCILLCGLILLIIRFIFIRRLK